MYVHKALELIANPKTIDNTIHSLSTRKQNEQLCKEKQELNSKVCAVTFLKKKMLPLG